ncbi:MAG: hypothetical protein ACXADH_09900 [Candidatus Kariarchaeaceae archaeon]|jgi:hypothetical protein
MTSEEFIARAFHEAYEELAPSFGYETRKKSRVDWKDIPENNRNLMIATVIQLLNDGTIHPGRESVMADIKNYRPIK